MKPGARVLAVDDSPLAGKKIRCTGVVARLESGRGPSGLAVEGIISFTVTRDGADAAQKLVRAVRRSRFRNNIKAVIIHSVTLAGLNVVDAKRVRRELGVPVICATKKRPGENEIQKALSKTRGGLEKIRLVEEAGPVHQARGAFFHAVGTEPSEAARILNKLGGYPWPLRLAHLIGSAMVFGESRGG